MEFVISCDFYSAFYFIEMKINKVGMFTEKYQFYLIAFHYGKLYCLFPMCQGLIQDGPGCDPKLFELPKSVDFRSSFRFTEYGT